MMLAAQQMRSGCWSASRSSVMFTARLDGALDAWDLLTSWSKPAASVQVCQLVCYFVFYIVCLGGYVVCRVCSLVRCLLCYQVSSMLSCMSSMLSRMPRLFSSMEDMLSSVLFNELSSMYRMASSMFSYVQCVIQNVQ